MFRWWQNRHKRYAFRVEVKREDWEVIKDLFEEMAHNRNLYIYFTATNKSAATAKSTMQVSGSAKNVANFRHWLGQYIYEGLNVQSC